MPVINGVKSFRNIEGINDREDKPAGNVPATDTKTFITTVYNVADNEMIIYI